MSAPKKIRYFFEAALLYGFYGFFSILPVSVASWTGGVILKIIGPQLATSRKVLRHINIAFPELNDTDAYKIQRDMWENMGRVFAEYPHLKQISKSRTNITGKEILSEGDIAKRPIIFIGAHIANWEVLGPAMALQLDIKALMVYRPPNNPVARTLLHKARDITPNMSFTTKSSSGARDMVSALKNKHNIALLFDQKYNRGLNIPFFGKDAMTSSAFAELALKYNASIIPLQIIRKHNAHFEIIIHTPLETKHKSVEDILSESHIVLEDWIKQHPGQWLWLHRRWKNK